MLVVDSKLLEQWKDGGGDEETRRRAEENEVNGNERD